MSAKASVLKTRFRQFLACVGAVGLLAVCMFGLVALVDVSDSHNRLVNRRGEQRQAAPVAVAGAARRSLLPMAGSGSGSTDAERTPLLTTSLHNADPAAQARVIGSYGKLPLSSEENQGQIDSRVKFLSRSRGYTLFLTADEAVLALRQGENKSKVNGQRATGKNDKSIVPQTLLNTESFPAFFNPRGTGLGNGSPLPLFFSSRAEEFENKAALPLKTAVLRMKLVGANPEAKALGIDELPGKSSYFIGNDSKKWRTNVATYAKVRYREVYPGVDLVYYGNERQLEYDFVVAPGADPKTISVAFDGAEELRVDAQGDLVVHLKEGDVRFHKPLVYQPALVASTATNGGSSKDFRDSHYVLNGKSQVGFEVAAYDAAKPLVIDPALSFSTYLGGSSFDEAEGIAVDASGNAYVTGFTESPDFPTTPGAFQTTSRGGGDAFVTKLNPAGSGLVYSTYLGGSLFDRGFGIAVDASGNAYVTGFTESPDFPTTPGAFQTTFGGGGFGSDAFVAKLNSAGSGLVYSTYLGGSTGDDEGVGIAVDASGNAYVTGGTDSTNFPTTAGAFQTTLGGAFDAFVTKLNPAGSALIYSTYLGGSSCEAGNGIAVDASGKAYVTGGTGSTNFPTTPGAFQTTFGGGFGFDAFVTKLNPTGSGLVYSTYLGGSSAETGNGIAVDPSGNAYVTGGTLSTNFPTTPGAFQTAIGGFNDAFVTKLNPAGSGLVYSTYLGGSGTEGGGGIAVDPSGNAYVTGGTDSTNFPTTPGAFQTTSRGGGDAFVTKLNPTGSGLVYSTYLGGSSLDQGVSVAVDRAGKAYVVGLTNSHNFPTTPGAFDRSCGTDGACNGGLADAFVAKIVPFR